MTSISRMLRSAARDIEDVPRWEFVANPACCEKCMNYNGRIVRSKYMPTWSPHDPNQREKYNCRCHWRKV